MRGDLGVVFQQFNLWPHMTVLGNVVEALIHVRGMKCKAHHRKQHWPGIAMSST